MCVVRRDLLVPVFELGMVDKEVCWPSEGRSQRERRELDRCCCHYIYAHADLISSNQSPQSLGALKSVPPDLMINAVSEARIRCARRRVGTLDR